MKSDTGDLLHEYIRLQHAITVTGDFGGRTLQKADKLKEELISRGFKIDAYGKIENLGDFEINT